MKNIFLVSLVVVFVTNVTAQESTSALLTMGKWQINSFTRGTAGYTYDVETGELDMAGMRVSMSKPESFEVLRDDKKKESMRTLLTSFATHCKTFVVFQKDGTYLLMRGDIKLESGTYKVIENAKLPGTEMSVADKGDKIIDMMKTGDKYFVREVFVSYDDDEPVIKIKGIERADKLFWRDYNYMLKQAK